MSRNIYITDDCLMDIAYKHMDDIALIGLQNALEEIPTADVVSKEKYDELNERYHRLLESAKILSDSFDEYLRRTGE